MSADEQQGVVLSGVEVQALARRLIAHHVADPGDWLDWGDVPMLAEGTFEALVNEVDRQADVMAEHSRSLDRFERIDSALLWERVQ